MIVRLGYDASKVNAIENIRPCGVRTSQARVVGIDRNTADRTAIS